MSRNEVEFKPAANTAVGPKHHQEMTRSWLAKGIFIVFAATILIVLVYVLFNKSYDSGKVDFIKYIITGLIGIMGAILGYYFGKK